MSQDLASLVIGLRADVATLQSDMGKAISVSQHGASQMAHAFDSLNDAFGEIGKRATEMGRLLVGAIGVERVAELGKSALEAGAKIADLSQKVGVSASTLSQYSVAAKLADSSIEEVGGGLAKLAKIANDAGHGNEQAAAAFKSLGISVRDSAGALKPTGELFDDVSKKMAGLKDGTGKTAQAMALFGKSGAELIPFLNEYGANIDAAKEKSKELGLTLSDSQANQFKTLADTFDEIGLAVRGNFTQALTVLIPYIQDFADDALDAAKQADEWKQSLYGTITVIHQVQDELSALGLVLQNDTENTPFFEGILKGTQNDLEAFARMKADAKTLWQDLKLGFAVAWNGGKPPDDFVQTWNADLDAIDQGLQDSLGSAQRWTDGIKQSSAVLSSLSDAVSTVSGSIKDGHLTAEQYAKDMDLIGRLGADAVRQGADQAQVARIVDAAYAQLGNTLEASSRKGSDGFDRLGSSANAMAERLASAQSEAQRFLASVDSFGADKYTKAVADYNAKLEKVNEIFARLIASGEDYGKAMQFSADATARLKDGLDSLIQSMRNQNDVDAILSANLARAQTDMDNMIRLAGMDEEARKAEALATQLVTAALGDLKDFVGPLTEEQQRVIDKLNAMAKETVHVTTELEKQKQVQQEWVGIWKSGLDNVADAFAKFVVEGGSFMKSLVDIAKQVVEAIIAQFAKLAFINPILNAIFGTAAGNGSLLPVLGGVGAVALGTSGTAMATTAGGNAAQFGTASGGLSLLTAGKQIWNGFSTAASNFWYGSPYNPASSNFVGPPIEGQTFGPQYGGYGSGFGQALGIGGALYAGYNRYQQGGALGGAAGGITYGVGTYAAGAGLASAAAGTGFAAGVSGAFAAIPVVGWIALAAMLVNMISGGKLFGTDANKLVGGGSTLSIGAGGADVASHYTLKGQKPLFGGSYYEEHAYTDQAAVDAANQFFAQLKSGTEDFAKQFGVTMGDIVGGTFEQTFDKHGNVTSSSSTVNGVTYDNDTVQQFQERIVAENELAILGQFDDKLSEAIDKYRQNADDLYAITNDLATAQLGFNQGLTFLALGSDQSTSALLHLAETSQHFGETVDQTLQRLMAAQAQYDQFVGQFKPATNYVDDFEGTLSQINQQMQANIKQANALAQAAGAAGASEQDLANIHKYAAQQAQQAFAALQASAQSLAFSLGLTTIGSLDQVNAEIERLQAKANTSSNAVRDFGQAMQTAADNAKHAMDLLLGDLSPLNDQQKLQKALEGLRAGTVTQDQVLEIGRRLYSSTAQYTALFNMVQAMGGSGAATQIGGAGFGGGGGGLSAAESQRLHDLLKQQQQLQAAAQLQQYQTLAQQVAEIASFKGEDWHQVLKDMGIDIADFEKGLGLNEKQTEDYITAIQKQTDDNGENTASIVAVLIQIRDAITGTPPTSDGDANGNGPAGGAGHSGHGSRGRNFSDDDADAFGRAVARHSNHAARPRSERPPTSAATTR